MTDPDFPGNIEQRESASMIRKHYVESIEFGAYPRESTISFEFDNDDNFVYFGCMNEVNPDGGYIKPDGKVVWL